MSNDFFPPGYEENKPSSTGGYTKLQDGDNTLRILDKPIFGYEGWKDNKPYRFETESEAVKMPGLERVRFFLAFPIWNYTTKAVEIFKATQVSIRETIEKYVGSPKWGDPSRYDLVINRSGEGLDTKYITTANPPSDIPTEAIEALKEIKISWDRYMASEDPFSDEVKVKSDEPAINPEDLPF